MRRTTVAISSGIRLAIKRKGNCYGVPTPSFREPDECERAGRGNIEEPRTKFQEHLLHIFDAGPKYGYLYPHSDVHAILPHIERLDARAQEAEHSLKCFELRGL